MGRKIPYTNATQGQKKYHTQTLNMGRVVSYTNTEHRQKKYHTQTLNADRKSTIHKH